MSEHDPQKHANPPLSPADKDKDAEADHALAMDQRKARYAATLADRAKSLERLYDYTKFHIGVYLSLTTAYIAIATLKPTALPDTTSRCASSIGVYGLIATDPWFMALAVASFMLAGLAGGVIVSSITIIEAEMACKGDLARPIPYVNTPWPAPPDFEDGLHRGLARPTPYVNTLSCPVPGTM